MHTITKKLVRSNEEKNIVLIMDNSKAPQAKKRLNEPEN